MVNTNTAQFVQFKNLILQLCFISIMPLPSHNHIEGALRLTQIYHVKTTCHKMDRGTYDIQELLLNTQQETFLIRYLTSNMETNNYSNISTEGNYKKPKIPLY
jgi:hypothetical protein